MDEFGMIKEARVLLGLGEEATRAEIEDAFRKLSLRYHPDRCPEKDKQACEEEFKKLVRAKDVIMRYCANYRYSFRENDVKRNTRDGYGYDHYQRFFEGWL